jgi:hypothetical protein
VDLNHASYSVCRMVTLRCALTSNAARVFQSGHPVITGSTALCWALVSSQFRNLFYIDGRTPWAVDQSVAKPLLIHTGKDKHRINAYTKINVLSGTRTHYSSAEASKNRSCLRPRGHCDRR